LGNLGFSKNKKRACEQPYTHILEIDKNGLIEKKREGLIIVFT
jgi:hypothetical protein